MTGLSESHTERLTKLVRGALKPPPGKRRIALAVAAGLLVHSVFAIAVLSMILGMYFGMSRGLGTLPWPVAILGNAALLVQFPLAHSFLLTRSGALWMSSLVPGTHGGTLVTTTYVACPH